MPDISNQLIKDSYNYVLQSDVSSGIVYRVGGNIPVNPIFLSGLTVNGSFIYNNGTEQPNYVLTTDGTGLAFWGPQSGSSGIQLTYYVTGTTPSGVTLINGDRWFNTNTGIELVWINDGDSQQWIQPFSVPGPVSPDVGYYTTTGITTSQSITWDKTYWGISANTNTDIILPSVVSKEGYYIIVKDEKGNCGTYRIRLTPTSGLIDGNNYIDMNINFMSLTCMVRGGNWYLI